MAVVSPILSAISTRSKLTVKGIQLPIYPQANQ